MKVGWRLRVSVGKKKNLTRKADEGCIWERVKWPCTECRKGVDSNSILCSECRRWVHKRCSSINDILQDAVNLRCVIYAGT